MNKVEFDPTLVHDWLSRSARRFPNKEALVCGQQRWTYRTLDRRTDHLAAALQDMQVHRQDRIVVLLDNSSETVISLYGILKAGGVFIILSGSVKGAKLRYILENSEANVLITHTSKARVAADALDQMPRNIKTIWVGPKNKIPAKFIQYSLSWDEMFSNFSNTAGDDQTNGQLPRCIDVDLATLIYTSGSTGEPKGVMSTHHNMISAARSIIQYIENAEEDIILDVLPVSFDYGLYQVIMAFMFGGTVVLEKSFLYLHKILELISREKVTGFPIVPTVAAMLLKLQDLKKYDLSNLRYITNTGAALPVEHIRRLKSMLPHVRLISMFGLTECKRVCYLPPEELEQRPSSVGKAMPNCEVFVVDEDGNEAAPGQTGELIIRGSNVMQGYWKDPYLTSKAYRNRRYPSERMLYSGDYFRKDDSGFLYFLGRKDDMIKSKGERISAKEAENIICALDGVAEASVIGMPDEILGQAIKAFIVTAPLSELTEKQVMKYCSANMETFMVPKYVEFTDELPKTPNGKIDKKQLKSMEVKTNMGIEGTFSAEVLKLHCAQETIKITHKLREIVLKRFKKRGVIVALSGGIDSSVVGALCVRALGKNRVLGLLMPEKDSAPETYELSQLISDHLEIQTVREDITDVLESLRCYRRRDDAIRSVVPEYGPGYKCKIVLPSVLDDYRYRIFSVVVQSPDGEQKKVRLTPSTYLGIVAATNFKQRVRKMLEYYHADRLNYAVAGTPNRQEYDQGFFVKLGDGAADVKPIAHLHKTQVYQMAEFLGVPEEICKRPPTTDTYPMRQSQEEFYFSVPYDKMDLCLYGKNHGVPPDEVAAATEMTAEQVERVYRDIDAKRNATRYLHTPSLLVDKVEEISV